VAMPIYLLQSATKGGVRSGITQRLRATIPDLSEVTSLEATLKSGGRIERSERPIVLVVVPPGVHGNFAHFVDMASRYGGTLSLVLIGEEISASDYKRLVRSGIADWVSANAGASEVTEIIARLRREGDTGAFAARPDGNRPVTISFVPSAGGVGNTTLALEIASLLNADKTIPHRRICIVDLDFQTSHVCDYLDSEPRLHIAELSGAPERLDAHLLESFRTRHSSGIDVFAAPRSKFASETLNIDVLDALFSMIATRYDLVLIDYPSVWFPWTAQIIAASDAAVITGINTIPCLRQVSETLVLVRSSGSSALQIGIAVNRCERTMLGSIARRNHVEMALRDEQIFFIGARLEAVESVNMGVPMTLGGAAGKVRKELAPLAEFCAGVKSSHFVTA
jgi:pilus assembly protein CpaE